jgi:hypothetical protein
MVQDLLELGGARIGVSRCEVRFAAYVDMIKTGNIIAERIPS